MNAAPQDIANVRDITAKNTVKKRKKRKKRVGRTAQTFIAVATVMLALIILFTAAAAGVIYLIYDSTSDSSGLYSLKLTKNGKTVKTVSAEAANNVYGLYVPYSAISQIADISVAGDDKKINLVCLPSQSMITCTDDSTQIYVNGSSARLSIPVMFTENDYLLPIELFQNFVFGIDVEMGENGVCTLSRNDDSGDIRLKMSPVSDMQKAYFPESYKKYE